MLKSPRRLVQRACMYIRTLILIDVYTPVEPLLALTLSSFQFVEIPTGALQPPPYKYEEKSKHSTRKVTP